MLNKFLFFKYSLRFFIISFLCFSCNNKNEKAENSYNKNISFKTFNSIRVAENIYSIVSPSFGLPTPENKGWNSNVHFIVTKSGVLLFDTGSSESIGHKIKSTIATVTDLPVRWVVNSHSHADHWLGNAAFSDAEIISSNQALKSMQKYGQDDVAFYKKVTHGSIGSTRLLYPNFLLNKPQKRDFGGVKVEFIFADNGHSPGDVLMWLPKQKIVFGGDLLNSDWMPIITDHVKIPSLINSLNHITELKPTKVLTGHGNETSAKSIVRDINLLSDVWKKVKRNYKKGLTLNETILDIKTNLGLKYEPLYKNFTTEIERHVKLMYSSQQMRKTNL